ncbi:MAG: ABC transporter ATP-binding protein [Hyphomonadaceae bacterium]
MSSDLAISARGLGKRYRRIDGPQHNSLRDVISAGVGDLFASKQARAARQARETFWALQDASFDIAKGENVGIIGLNGAGKSTLLKLLSRITTPTTGEAAIHGRLGALLEVGTGFHGELTGRENTFLYGAILGMSRAEVARKYDAIVDFAEIAEFMETPVKRYSSGMYVRLAFAVAAHLDPDILLLDEVLAVGDFAFQRKCMNFARQLEQRGSTILFVSHNMFSIKAMCERVIYLKKGRIVYDGATDAGLKLYEDDSKLQSPAWYWDKDKNPSIVITDVKLLNKDGAEAGVFDFGERLTARIAYKTFAPIEHPDFRVTINRADETHCTTFSSVADNIDIPTIDGEGVIELQTPPLSLVSDLYTADIVVRERSYGRIVAAQIGGHFHVRHPVFASNAFGVFHEAGQWRVEPSDEKRPGLASGAR